MQQRRRILVLGAGGMIGREVMQEARAARALEMLAASHRDRPGCVRIDYESLTTAERWVAVLRSTAPKRS
jgi:dihydrodipicolinate reductase